MSEVPGTRVMRKSAGHCVRAARRALRRRIADSNDGPRCAASHPRLHGVSAQRASSKELRSTPEQRRTRRWRLNRPLEPSVDHAAPRAGATHITAWPVAFRRLARSSTTSADHTPETTAGPRDRAGQPRRSTACHERPRRLSRRSRTADCRRRPVVSRDAHAITNASNAE
jgi:hypothetical protein